MNDLAAAMIATLHGAYAHAATGDAAGARRLLLQVRSKVAIATAVPKEEAAGPKIALAGEAIAERNRGFARFIDLRARKIDARIAVAEGRLAEAIALLVGTGMAPDAESGDLLAALHAAGSKLDAALIPAALASEATTAARTAALRPPARLVLIAPETPRAAIDYERARPNVLGALVGGVLSMGTSLLGGISRTDGFRSSVDAAKGTTTVEFLGNTPSAQVVGEMTLLRAAALARDAGKTGLVVVDRKNFTRTMRTTRGGVPISSVAAGHKTELTVRFVDRAIPPADLVGSRARILDFATIIGMLGAAYYEPDAPARAVSSAVSSSLSVAGRAPTG